MKKVILSLTVLSILIGGVAFAAKPVPPSSGGISGKVIALDAGHGGTSLGAQYPANSGTNGLFFEKDQNLSVVYALKGKLEAAGAHVILARKCDENVTWRSTTTVT